MTSDATGTSAEDRGRARLRTLGLAAACAVLTIAVALPAVSTAQRVKTLGKAKTSPDPTCPANCTTVGSVTGFQTRADGQNGIFRAPEDGRLVAWAVKLSSPTSSQRSFFGSLWETERFGQDPSARIAVLSRQSSSRYKLLRESPAVNLSGSLGEKVYFTLGDPLRINKDQVVALTLPTWAPLFTDQVSVDGHTWRASRPADECPVNTVQQAKRSKPQQKVGSTRTYGCDYNGARLLYWAYYVPR